MGKRKLQRLEMNSKLTWAEWLINRKETLTPKEELMPDSNFIPHTRDSHGFAGMPAAYSPGVLWKLTKRRKKSQ
jgi:hypothetical protein